MPNTNRTFLVRSPSMSGSFGLAMVCILARPNSPDVPPNRTKKVRLGKNIEQLYSVSSSSLSVDEGRIPE